MREMVALVIFAMSLAFPMWSMAAGSEGLVLYLPFDEEGDPVDKSPDPTEAEIKGELKHVAGKFGGALEFNGNSANYVEVTHSDKLEGMKALTVEAWIKPYKPDALARGIVSKRVAWQQSDVYNLFSWTDMKLYARVNAQSNVQIISQTVLEDKRWYHVAYVFDGKAKESERQKLYVNGTLEATLSHPHNSVQSQKAPLWIGILNSGYAQAWNGVIDEVRIWNRALSEEEIKAAIEGTLLPVKPLGRLATTWGEIKNAWKNNGE